MRNDGFSAVSDDTENLFGICVTVGLAVLGAMIGLIGGGVTGLLASTVMSAITGPSKSSKPNY